MHQGHEPNGRDYLKVGQIMEMLRQKGVRLIAIGERAGSGVPDIYSVWADKGWKDPEIEEQFDPDRTILTLAFTKKQAEKTSEKSKREKHKHQKHLQTKNRLSLIFKNRMGLELQK